MAIVIDEYGAVEVGDHHPRGPGRGDRGEIEDEFDIPDSAAERADEVTIRTDGTNSIDDFNEQFECDLPDDDYHTVAGFVFGALGRAAEPGDEVVHEGTVFRVDSVEGQRIDRLTVTFGWRHALKDEEAPEDES